MSGEKSVAEKNIIVISLINVFLTGLFTEKVNKLKFITKFC